MDIYKEIVMLDSKQLKEYVDSKIKILEEEAKEENGDNITIGYNLDYNPVKNKKGNKAPFDISLHCFYLGYVYKGARVVYGMSYDKDGYIGNDGKYYYVDQDDYIMEFCEYIKDKEILDELELFDYILEFMRDYFDDRNKFIINERPNREEMFQMLYQTDHSFYPPIKEHGLSWFKGSGNALCSEYSVIANNIMNFMGIDSYLVVGHYESDGEVEGHAYNMISYDEEETGRRVDALIDYGNFINIFDSNFNVLSESPFMAKIKELNNDLVEKLVNNEKHLRFEDYCYVIVGDDLLQMGNGKVRDYYIDNRALLEPQKRYTK